MSSRIRPRAERLMLALKPPHRPRFAVIATTRWVWSLPVPASMGAASPRPRAAPARLPSMRAMRSAYGRAASAASCERRSFAAATIFMAEVIFLVDCVEAMRTRRSFKLGMGGACGFQFTRQSVGRLRERRREVVQELLE